ncbi:MAG: CAP domain-containing protein, partial [Oscillospiraceae bacterium]|nr:CAP domain-containing protein [Oscillospiraceae bacterium]
MKRKLLSIFITVATFVCLFAFSAQAAETVDVTVYGTYNYSYANKVLSLINEERAKQGLAALKMDPNLTEYAMQRAAEISVYYDHTRPDGRNFDTVVTDSTYTGAKGENIALGQKDPADVMTSWMNSKGHRENILKTDYKSVGIGCFRQDNGKYCWVQLFYTQNKGYSYSKSSTINKTAIPISIKPELVQLYISGLSGGDTRITNSNNSDVTASLFYGKTTPVTLKLKNASEKLTIDVKTALSGGYTFNSGNSSLIGVNASGFIARAKGVTTMGFSLDNLYSGSFPVGVFDEVKLNVDGIYHNTKQMVRFSWDNSSGGAYRLMYQYPDSGNMWYEQTNVEEWNPNYNDTVTP